MRVRMIALCGVAVGTVTGCASNQHELHNWLLDHREHGASIDYRVGIPDELTLSAPRIPEIDGEVQTIQPDGKITLRLLGEVRVVGMTTREIDAKLTTLLQEYYEDPKVQVRVTQYRSKKIYVFGQTGRTEGGGVRSAKGNATSIPYTGKNSLIDTLATTGLNFIAWRSQVKVIRANPDKLRRHILTVDVDRMMQEGDTSMNVLLEPGDIVYVPPTPLGWVGLRVQEVLFPFAPVINAYTAPATVIDANDEYQNND